MRRRSEATTATADGAYPMVALARAEAMASQSSAGFWLFGARAASFVCGSTLPCDEINIMQEGSETMKVKSEGSA